MKKLLLSLLLLPYCVFAQYTGTGSVTQGLGTATNTNIYTCTGGRIANIGTITATDNTTWVLPAEVNYTNNTFPFASDLNNPCNGNNYSSDAIALAALDGSDIITIDPDGELITAFIFADNYFEMYINGIPVGKDNVPYTQFNSNIVRFKVNRPFTIAMLLVDWEEHLGVGSEVSNGFQYHDGDGGMVAVFKDANNNIIATTGSNWKAQTFYTSPIADLSCPTENGTTRLSSNCTTQDTNNGASFYGLHWARPASWESASFNDSSWPPATTYTNTTIGVNNKPAYTNFTNIFDAPENDAQFIWSTNVILDNELIVRYTVNGTTGIDEINDLKNSIGLYPNPANDAFYLNFNNNLIASDIINVTIYNSLGMDVFSAKGYNGKVDFGYLSSGLYSVKINTTKGLFSKKLVVE